MLYTHLSWYFVELNHSGLKIYFFSCWSDLGRLGNGKQLVSLGRQCYSQGTAMHELLHTLGFYHEQSRADRDEYVDIHYDNIRDGKYDTVRLKQQLF